MANSDIRLAAMSAGVRLWQIAEALGMYDTNFSKLLRKELPQDKKATVIATIKKLSAERGA